MKKSQFISGMNRILPVASAGIVKKSQFISGMNRILPVASAGIVDGIVFGVLARQSGLGMKEIMLLSLLVNAGSSQFAAVGLISQGVIGWPIYISTALLNARQLLYGLSLGPSFKKFPAWKLAFMSAYLNDETYAVKTTYLHETGKPSLSFFYGAAFIDYLIWNASSLMGALFGAFLQNPETYGLDFAFIATFLGFLAVNLRSSLMMRTALLACVAACGGYWLFGMTGAVITGTLVAVASGVVSNER